MVEPSDRRAEPSAAPPDRSPSRGSGSPRVSVRHLRRANRSGGTRSIEVPALPAPIDPGFGPCASRRTGARPERGASLVFVDRDDPTPGVRYSGHGDHARTFEGAGRVAGPGRVVALDLGSVKNLRDGRDQRQGSRCVVEAAVRGTSPRALKGGTNTLECASRTCGSTGSSGTSVARGLRMGRHPAARWPQWLLDLASLAGPAPSHLHDAEALRSRPALRWACSVRCACPGRRIAVDL